MRKATKALLIAIGVIIFLIVIYYIIAIGAIVYSGYNTVSKTDPDFSNYQMYRSELHYAEDFLPAEDELIYAKDLLFSYQHNYKLIFISKTVAVTVQYDPDEYLKAKEHIIQRYVSWILRCFTIVITIMNWTTPLPTRATISAWFPTMAADTLAWSVQTMILTASLTCITAILTWTILPKQTKILIRKCAH